MFIQNLKTYKTWISQFDIKDRQYAELLANSIIYIEESKLKLSLYNEISNKYGNTKTALYPIIDVPFEEVSLNGEIIKRYKYEFFSEKSKQPNYQVNLDNTGSESIINYLIRTLSSNNKNFIPAPSLDELLKNKITNIVLINDIASSGKQTLDFFYWFYNNKTIKSWISGKHIQVIILLYTCTEKAYEYILKDKKIKKTKTSLNIVQHTSFSGSDLWKSYEDNKIRTICKSYAKKFKLNKNYALGFKKSFSLTIFSYKTPNNVPAILWQKSSIWNPLIPINPDLSEIPKIDSWLYSFKNLIKKLNINFLFYNIKNEKNKNYKIFLVLSTIKHYRIHNPRIISQYLELSYDDVIKSLNILKHLQLINDNNFINEEGEKVIVKLRNKIIVSNSVDDDDSFYYPLSIRDSD